MNRFTLIAAAATAALLSPAAALAETQQVRTSDLDLSTPAGQAQLETRIARAARAVCSSADTGTRIPRVDKACLSKAAASARAAVAMRAPTPKLGG